MCFQIIIIIEIKFGITLCQAICMYYLIQSRQQFHEVSLLSPGPYDMTKDLELYRSTPGKPGSDLKAQTLDHRTSQPHFPVPDVP